MARFLLIADGVEKGKVTGAFPDGADVGRMCDYDLYVASFGSADGWPDSFDEIWDEVVDGSVTGRRSLRLANSANAGIVSGAGTLNVTVRDLGDTKNRVDATVDASGNRTAVITDVT
jgi:hypothetical protein